MRMLLRWISIRRNHLRSRRLHRRDLLLPIRLLTHPQFIFHLNPKIVRSPPKLPHQLPKLTRQLGQLLRPEQQQGNNKDDGAILKTGHRCTMIRADRHAGQHALSNSHNPPTSHAPFCRPMGLNW